MLESIGEKVHSFSENIGFGGRNEECHARVNHLVEQMKTGAGITEELKAVNR